MTLPFAALGALVAALIETTVLPYLTVGGATINLVLVLAVAATMSMSTEDGFVWAFVGGLMLDMLTPARPLGSTTLTLLLVTGGAVVSGRVLGQGRRWPAVAAVFALTWVYQALLVGVLNLTEGLALSAFSPRIVLIAALLNLLAAIPVAVGFSALERRFGAAERPDF